MATPDVDDSLEELPPLDGDEDAEDEAPPDGSDVEIDETTDGGDPLDDAVAEGDPGEELDVGGAESGWLDDSDATEGLDVGPMDLLAAEEEDLLTDTEGQEEVGTDGLDLGDESHSVLGDAGEEGPLDEDEELREEDLPALDADEEGDVDEDGLYDRSLLDEEELRWDDRAWTRTDAPPPPSDDRGPPPQPADGARSSRDETWRRLTASGRAMAAALVEDDAVVVALASDETRAVLVRVSIDGVARIVAEIESDGDACHVDALLWDPERRCLFARGSFGVASFRA